jgi:predicted DCC family thiol-disulfide oxidoreductase YuxK
MSPVLFYDGECALCAWSVRFVLRHERRATLRFASLEGAFARSIVVRHPGLQGLDAVVWYEPAGESRAERLLTRSAAVLEVLRYVGGAWKLLGLVAAAVPAPLRDAAYRVVARHRRRLFGQADSCMLPPAARHRFLP